MTNPELDWGKYSIKFDGIKKDLAARDLDLESEAETRFHIIDRLIRELLAWEPGQIGVEKRTEVGIIDYLLRSGDTALVIEAKRIGSKLASPTRRKTFKLKGSFLGRSEMKVAIEQAAKYAESSMDRDELFAQAVEFVKDLDQVTASGLQKKFDTGYARSARILDELELAGIIGSGEGAKPRKVLIKKS